MQYSHLPHYEDPNMVESLEQTNWHLSYDVGLLLRGPHGTRMNRDARASVTSNPTTALILVDRLG